MTKKHNGNQYLVYEPLAKQFIGEITKFVEPVVSKKATKPWPVRNRRTKSAFNIENSPERVKARKRIRAMRKAVMESLRDQYFRNHIQGNSIRGEFSHPETDDAKDVKALLELTR